MLLLRIIIAFLCLIVAITAIYHIVKPALREHEEGKQNSSDEELLKESERVKAESEGIGHQIDLKETLLRKAKNNINKNQK